MFLVLSSSWLGWAPPHPDAVTSLPGLDGPLRSQLFSGYLRATADGQTFYSHYVLTESRSSPADDPLVLWQQGGPGSSGFGFGFLAEMGPYVLDADSLALNASAPRLFEREYSWDASANMLLFEHPPGTGFSYCVDAAEALIACTWNDQTQAEAFHATLLAFYTSFPQYRQHELRLIGESYAGLLLPYLAAEIYRHPTETPAKQLKGLAVGNGCPGTSGATPAKRGTCNGPYGSYDTQHVLELAYGHSALPRPLWQKLQAACGFPCKAATWSEGAHALALTLTSHLSPLPSPPHPSSSSPRWPCAACDGPFSAECEALLQEADEAIGPFNVYNFYDNCGDSNQAHAASAAHAAHAAQAPQLRSLLQHAQRLGTSAAPLPSTGGQEYPCGTGHAATVWANSAAVREALHVRPEAFYGRPWSLQAGAGMQYTT